MRRLRTTSPSHATSALAVLTLLGTITACSMFGANTAVAASPPAQSPHHAGVVLDSGTSSNSNAGISQTTGSNSSHGSGSSTGSTGASVPKGLESFYHQDLTWTDCTDDATGTAFQCATVTVPLDYDNPQGQTITVALKKLPSTSSSPRGSGEAASPSSSRRPSSTRVEICPRSWRTTTSSASTPEASASPPPSPAGPPRTSRRFWPGRPKCPSPP